MSGSGDGKAEKNGRLIEPQRSASRTSHPSTPRQGGGPAYQFSAEGRSADWTGLEARPFAALQRKKAANDTNGTVKGQAGRTGSMDAQRVAAEGLTDAARPLPHLEQIQRSFGTHDVQGVEAHVGPAADRANAELGAKGFATGPHVAFAGAPDLHTAAHEAAHVVQQRGGVRLKGALDTPGDRYEQHADAVADRVVRGESAEALLDRFAGGAGRRAPGVDADAPVQRSKIGGLATGEEASYPFQGVAVTPLAGLPQNQVDGLTTLTIPHMLDPHIAGFSAQQFGALSAQLIGAFTTAQMGAWRLEHVSAMTNQQTPGLSQDQFIALPAAYLAALSTDAFAAITANHFAQLSQAQTQLITVEQAGSMTGDQFVKIAGARLPDLASGTFKAIPAAHFSRLTDDQAQGFTNVVGSRLTADQFEKITGDQLAKVPDTAFAQIPPANFAKLTNDQAGKLTATLAAVLTDNQLAKITGDKLAKLTTDAFKAIPANSFTKLTEDQCKKLTDTLAGAMTEGQFEKIPGASLAKLTTTAFGALPATHFKKLSDDQAGKLSTTLAAALSEDQFKNIPGSKLGKVPGASFAQIPSGHFAQIVQAQAQGLTATQTAQLTQAQLGQFPAARVADVGNVAFAGLTNTRLGDISYAQAQYITSGQLAALTISRVQYMDGWNARGINPAYLRPLVRNYANNNSLNSPPGFHAANWYNNGSPLPYSGTNPPYYEFDIYPTVNPRGTHRLLYNRSTGNWYYTTDHYSSFSSM